MNQSNQQKLTVSIAETAALLGVSRPTVYRLVERDDFPVFRVGGRVLISRQGLERWIAEQSGQGAN